MPKSFYKLLHVIQEDYDSRMDRTFYESFHCIKNSENRGHWWMSAKNIAQRQQFNLVKAKYGSDDGVDIVTIKE